MILKSRELAQRDKVPFQVTSDPAPTTLLLSASSQCIYGLLVVGLLGTTSVHKMTTLAGSTLMAAPIVNLCREHWG